MAEKSHWAEIRCDYIDETDSFWRVDAWETADDAEEGKVIAYIDDLTGRVIYTNPLARVDTYAQEVIQDRVDVIKQNGEKKLLLVSARFEDFYCDDEHFIFEVPSSRLIDARKAVEAAELKWRSAKLEDVFEISDYIEKEFTSAGIPFEEKLFDEGAVDVD